MFGVFFLPDMDAAAARLTTLLKPGGRFVVTPAMRTGWLGRLGLRGIEVATVPHHLPLDERTSWAIVLGSAMRVRLNGVAEHLLPRVRARFEELLATRKVDRMNAVSLIGVGRTG